MAKILLDVGAHIGETIQVAGSPRWSFDRIYSFEPASSCWPQLDQRAAQDARIAVIRAALWKADGVGDLYGGGDVGASMFRSKTPAKSELICTIEASSWFKDWVSVDDVVFAKLNCEGAELEILENLIESGEIRKIDHLVVHFDLRKVPERRSEDQRLERILDTSGVNWISAERIFYGRNVFEKTQNWLAWCHAGPFARLYYKHVRSLEYACRLKLCATRRSLKLRSAVRELSGSEDLP